MNVETDFHPGAQPYSLNEIIDLFLGDLNLVSTFELAKAMDDPFFGRLFETILECRRANRLGNDALDADQETRK